MTESEKQEKIFKKILEGLEHAYQKLIEFKKDKNSVLVIMDGDKVVKIKPK